MVLNTCSQVMSLAKKLESESASFYAELSKRFSEHKDLFLSLAQENETYVTQIERAYYGVITDAIEGCFAFNINVEDYRLDTEGPAPSKLSDALEKGLEIEEKLVRFYTDAAEQSQSLMADVPRAFRMVVKKRRNRQATLRSILEGANP